LVSGEGGEGSGEVSGVKEEEFFYFGMDSDWEETCKWECIDNSVGGWACIICKVRDQG